MTKKHDIDPISIARLSMRGALGLLREKNPKNVLSLLTLVRSDLDRAIAMLTPKPVTLREWPKTVPDGRWAWHIMPDEPAVIIGFFRLDAGEIVFINEEDGADFDRKMHHDGEYFQRIEETPCQT